MALASGRPAPYAPASVVVNVITRHRAVGIPKIDAEVLERLGVTESLRPRTLVALKTLDFYDEDGNVTPDFDALKRVSTEEFPERLAQLLTRAYKPIFEIVGDVSSASHQVIDDAFRTFEPAGQRVRMVQLFIGLMVHAGLMPDGVGRKPGPLPKPKNGAMKAAPRPRVTKPEAQHAPLPFETPPPVPAPPPTQPPAQPPLGDHRTTVELDGIGHVTLAVNINPLLLTKVDRDFFYDVVDKMNEWRASRLPAENPRVDDTTTSEVSTP